MAKFRFHRAVAVVVLVGTAAWVATGKFSSVGSAQPEEGVASQAVTETAAPARTVAVVAPPRVEHARAIRISGQTAADKRVVLATRIGGIVGELPVRRGDWIEQGGTVLRLESEEREAGIDMARAVLAQREAETAAIERLVGSGNAARLQADQARSALASARSQLEAMTAELDRTVVKAPFSGYVDRVDIELGSSVMQGAQVATILALDPVLAVGEVSERELGYLRIGETAEVRLVDGRTVSGSLRYVSRDASAQTRTFRVEIAVPNPDNAIPAGMTAEIVLRAAPVDSVILPRSVVSLSANGDLGIRAVDKDGKVQFFPIDLVDDTPTGLVLAGIPADARVIVQGQELVTEGDTVNPVEADAALINRLVGEATGGTQ